MGLLFPENKRDARGDCAYLAIVICPLCESGSASDFFQKTDPKLGVRKYFRCPECYLIFLPPSAHLNTEDEKSRYDLHQNNPESAGYVQSLQKLVGPLCERLAPSSSGLDFGCGPQSVLKLLFEERGHSVQIYDPYYFPDDYLLRGRYDFVACSEVVEHFYNPQKEFVLLNSLLKTQGSRLGILTQMLENERAFRDWWYHRDPTHVCFFRKETFQWIGGWKRLSVEFPDPNVVIYTK
jgi:methyltransferase family protein